MAKKKDDNNGLMNSNADLELLVMERTAYMRRPLAERAAIGQFFARKAMAVDNSDPFIGARVNNTLLRGNATPEDFFTRLKTTAQDMERAIQYSKAV